MRTLFSLSLTPDNKAHHLKLFSSWIVLLFGLTIWVALQSYLVSGPLSQRDQLPEVDDSLAYLARTRVMEQCPSHDCKALIDLKYQFKELPEDVNIQRQAEIAFFAFPFYHPLFSAILLSVNHFTHDLTNAYKILWFLSPLFWGIAFACFLTSLWGRAVAGITLFVLAFKVFPGTGIHYFTPTNLAIIIALLLWARILSKDGSAPIALILGSLILLAIHPIGLLLSLVAIILALTLSKKRKQDLIFIMVFFAVVLCAAFFFPARLSDGFNFLPTLIPSHLISSLQETLTVVAKNLVEIAVQLTRYKTAFFGPLIVLLPATLLGLFYLKKKRRKKISAVLIIFSLFLFASLLHSNALSSPAVLFFRLLAPFSVVLFAALPHLLYVMTTRIVNPGQTQTNDHNPLKSRFSALLILTVLIGYTLETTIPGMIQIQAVREYMIKRQPLSFNKEQTQLLLSKIRPQESVLYTSTMIMASYFTNNSLQLNTVYYHPSFAKAKTTSLLLQEKNIRFVVAYNPGVYHPTYAGLDEKNRCITSPEVTFFPLIKPRKSDPINQEGSIPVENFYWIEVYPDKYADIREIKIFISNPGSEKALKLIHNNKGEAVPSLTGVQQTIPTGWSGWLRFPLTPSKQGDSYKFVLPPGESKATISGISFNDDEQYWPWSHQATVIFQGKDTDTGRVQLSFNPSDLLPEVLKNRSISVIHDQGSSVLLELAN